MSNMAGKQPSREVQQAVKQQKELETWATNRIKSWEKLTPDDYDFRTWAKQAVKNCLRAGAVYEYARESQKLRCLLVLMNPKRPRQAWEILSARRRPRQLEMGATWLPVQTTWWPCSFNDLDEHGAERALGGFLYCLRDLADYLADNISFGELFRTKRDELENAFGGLNDLARVQREGRFFLRVNAVDLAWTEQQQATVWSDEQRRIIREDGSEVVALQIRWGEFTDKDIGAAMERFARAHRPNQENCRAPQRKGRGREDILLSALDNLSALRLIRWHPIAEAIHLFRGVRLNARGGALEQRKVREQKAEAENDFRRDFSFGEDPANCGTFAQSP
jgi:hypothetical protein